MLRDDLRRKILEFAQEAYPSLINGRTLIKKLAGSGLLDDIWDEEKNTEENIKATVKFLDKHIIYLSRTGFIKAHGATRILNESKGFETIVNITITEQGINFLNPTSEFSLFDSPNSLVNVDTLLEILNTNSDEIPQSTKEKITGNFKKIAGEGGKVAFSTLVRELIRVGMSGTI